MSDEIHRLLARQMKSVYPELLGTKNGMEFFACINKAYFQFEREQKILEESAQHMLSKIAETNKNLHTIIESLDGFNYHVSHDLKNSMINTLSLSRMLKKHLELGDISRVKEITEKLGETSGDGLRLVENFLRISQFESKLVEQELEEVNLPKLIETVIQSLDLQDAFTYSFERLDFETIHFKSLGMQSLLQNLITNAYKYKKIDQPLHIEIRLATEGSVKLISFKDNGIGINLKKDKDKLFKPFVRISNSLNQEGTGVGLFLVKKVVVEHFGSIEVFSEPGKGVEFVLKF